MLPLRRPGVRIGAAALGVAALAALVGTCDRGSGPPRAVLAPAPALAAAEAPAEPTPTGIVKAATVARSAKPAAAARVPSKAAPPPKKKKKKLRADVAPRDFVVSGIEVSEAGYKATIEGWIRMTRKGALAQPLLAFDLTDAHGRVIHSGSFTPVDATGPVWLGYDALGLKRVPFTTTVDLRADGGVLPAVPPRPYSASVRVAEVVDAKPAR